MTTPENSLQGLIESVKAMHGDLTRLQTILDRCVVLSVSSAATTLQIGYQIDSIISASGAEWQRRAALQQLRDPLDKLSSAIREASNASQ